jgi:Tol biopolymer transport system component
MQSAIRNLTIAATILVARAAPSTIAFVSTRHDPAGAPWSATEIYLMDGDGLNVRRVTNDAWGDGFPSVSPDGKWIVFDSNRLRAGGDPVNTSDLFVMNADGTGQTHLARGSSATWSPDGKSIAFHASASGTGLPIKIDPGAATTDSDIFLASVDELRTKNGKPKNITNNPAAIDDDPDWSPDGSKIVFTSHDIADDPINSVTAEIYVIEAHGSGKPVRLTNNSEEEVPEGIATAGSRRRDVRVVRHQWRRNWPDAVDHQCST